jgi:hypothetical protein
LRMSLPTRVTRIISLPWFTCWSKRSSGFIPSSGGCNCA